MAIVTSDQLVHDLHLILTSRIANPRFYKSRAKGFKNEAEFAGIIKGMDVLSLDAGQFLFSKKKDNTIENVIIYVTVSSDDHAKYTEFYELLSKMHEVKKLFFVKINAADQWQISSLKTKNQKGKVITSEILKPAFTVFEFVGSQWHETTFQAITDMLTTKRVSTCAYKPDEHLEYLKQYNAAELMAIYSNRYFLDIELDSYSKGMIDLDHVIKRDNVYLAIETKEKSPMKGIKDPNDKNEWAFGWDSRRFSWYMYLKLQIGLDSEYIVREIDHKTTRNFVSWRRIELDQFCRHVSWLSERTGGGGGGTVSAPYLAFHDLNRSKNVA